MNLETSDAALLKLAVHGDVGAFRRVYERHVSSVFRYCASLCRDRSGAEDSSQETWSALWVAKAKLELVTDSALPWLLVTARHKSLKWVADRQREAVKTARSDRREVPYTDAETLAGHAALVEFMRDVVESMAAVDQQLFVLCIEQRMSYMTAAATLGISESSVRNRLSRMRARLRTAMNSFGAA